MRLKNLMVVSVLFASGLAVADSYKADLGAKISRVDYDDFNGNSSTYGITGAFYFDGVETANVPLGEAAYVGKNSNVNAIISHSTWDDERLRLSTDSYRAGVEFFIPENFLYVSGGVTRAKYKSGDENDWDMSVGLTPIDGLLIKTSYVHDAGYDPNISAKYVTSIGNGQFINLEASLVDSDVGNIVTVGGDYYFDNSFSIGAFVSDSNSRNIYQLRTRKFFTEQLSGDVSLVSGENADALTLGVNFRF